MHLLEKETNEPNEQKKKPLRPIWSIRRRMMSKTNTLGIQDASLFF